MVAAHPALGLAEVCPCIPLGLRIGCGREFPDGVSQAFERLVVPSHLTADVAQPDEGDALAAGAAESGEHLDSTADVRDGLLKLEQVAVQETYPGKAPRFSSAVADLALDRQRQVQV